MGVGYKARWFFLVIWLLVFFVWWAAYVEGTVACISDDFRWQPVRYLFGLILFDWRPSLGDLWSEPLLPLGINGVFGLYITGRPGSISWGLVPCILFIICSVPLLFGLVFGYVGVSREASRELVAKSPIGLLPRLISTCLAGLLFACALLFLIKLLSIKWNILTYYVFSG